MSEAMVGTVSGTVNGTDTETDTDEVETSVVGVAAVMIVQQVYEQRAATVTNAGSLHISGCPAEPAIISTHWSELSECDTHGISVPTMGLGALVVGCSVGALVAGCAVGAPAKVAGCAVGGLVMVASCPVGAELLG